MCGIVLTVILPQEHGNSNLFFVEPKSVFVEFSLLESWLASSSALQLPLHQIESHQQATKAARSNACSSKPICSIAITEMWGLLCNSNCQTAWCSTLTAV